MGKKSLNPNLQIILGVVLLVFGGFIFFGFVFYGIPLIWCWITKTGGVDNDKTFYVPVYLMVAYFAVLPFVTIFKKRRERVKKLGERYSR